MKQPPTERHRAIANRCLEGKTLASVAAEFKTTVEQVRQTTQRVAGYDRGLTLLRADSASVEALSLMGKFPKRACATLLSNRIHRITDLAGIPLKQILTWPSIGRTTAAGLLELLAEIEQAEGQVVTQLEMIDRRR